jgi:hypothetical protein
MGLRPDYGTWGASLDDRDFATALLTGGIVRTTSPAESAEAIANRLFSLLAAPPPSAVGREPIEWSFPSDPGGFGDALYPPKLRDAWGLFRLRAPDVHVRLQIPNSPDLDGPWLAQQLTRPVPDPVSVYFRDDWMSSDADWGWPLEIGFLPTPTGGSMRVQPLARPWLATLIDSFELHPGKERCDLLVATETPAELLGALRSAGIHADANFVLLLGRAAVPWRRLVPALHDLASDLHASGVAMVDVPTSEWSTFFWQLVEHLSHDEPIDVALSGATTASSIQGPILIAHRELARVSRVSTRAEVLHAAIADRSAVVVSDGRARDAASRLEVLAAESPLPAPSEYVHESGAATTIANLGRDAGPLLAEAALTEETLSRRILARVLDTTTAGYPSPVPGGFVAGDPHVVEIGVGTPRTGWTAAETPFPDAALPPSRRPHTLQVVLAIPDLLPEPLVSTISLPSTGPSTTCSFPVGVVPSAMERVRGRISVVFRNRVLQTAILSAPVVTDHMVGLTGKNAIRVDVEAVIRPGLADLDRRRRFDASLVFNHTDAAVPAMQAFVNGRADLALHPDLDAQVRQFQRQISGIANDPDGYTALDTPQARALMAVLARLGTLLRDGLFAGSDRLEAVRAAERIQVVSVNPTILVPLELVYDRPSPAEDAALCPNTIARLGTGGDCGEDCPGGDAVPNPYVCPLAFWCSNKVIERHAADAAPADLLRDVRLELDPTSTKSDLPVFTGALFGASSRVDAFLPDGRQRVLAALTAAAGAAHLNAADTWETWKTEVTSTDPSLLLLLPHTDTDAADIQTIEIGSDHLAVDYLTADHVRAKDATVAPVVFLLGCSTALPKMPFQSVVIKLRALGASVVIGTVATILGRHAVPVAEAFVEELQTVAARETPMTFGEMIRETRRTLLGRGLVTALALTAYGDADWRIVAPPP